VVVVQKASPVPARGRGSPHVKKVLGRLPAIIRPLLDSRQASLNRGAYSVIGLAVVLARPAKG
jgi:hypothetical protein